MNEIRRNPSVWSKDKGEPRTVPSNTRETRRAEDGGGMGKKTLRSLGLTGSRMPA